MKFFKNKYKTKAKKYDEAIRMLRVRARYIGAKAVYESDNIVDIFDECIAVYRNKIKVK